MHQLCVSDVMSTGVITVSVDTPFRELVERLEAQAGVALPVLDPDGALVGIVSDSDLVAKQAFPGTRRRTWLPTPPWRRRMMIKAKGRTAAAVMTTPVITINGSASLAAAARLMVRHRIKQLPVLGLNGTVVGMVNRANLVTAFLRSDADIRTEIVQRIFGTGVLGTPETVTVRVHEGVVHLKGRLDHRSLVETVDDRVGEVDGVVAVVNDLEYRQDDTIRYTSRVLGPSTSARPAPTSPLEER